MDSNVVTALAAALGSMVGALSSIATTFMTQRAQTINSSAEWRRREQESLYKEFITEASRLSIHALTASLEAPDQMMALYALLSRIRLISSDEVVREGEKCCHRIIDQYLQPNLTKEQLRETVAAYGADGLDPLLGFSNACRNERLASRS